MMRSDRNRGQIKQLVLLAAIAIVGLSGMACEMPNRPVLPYHPQPHRQVTAQPPKKPCNTTET